MAIPNVSVIMSVYNGAPFLESAVSSILNQTYADFEFIVIDDGSTDNTWEILSAYASRDNRMVLVHNEANLGVARSRNRGIQFARGIYLACQDADDVSLPERLARQVEYLEAHPEVGLVGALPEFIDDQNDLLDGVHSLHLTDNNSIQRQLLNSNCICAGSVMMCRKWLDRVGVYDQDLAPSEDYDLWLRFAEVTQLANLAEPLYRYRQHRNSASSRRRYIQMHNKAVALERALARRYGATPPAALKKLAARDYLRAAYLGFESGERAGARESFERATAFAPWMCHSGTLIEDVMERYILNRARQEPYALAESLFNEFFPRTRYLARVKSRILSQLHMKEVFEAAKQEQYKRINEHLWAGIRNDPRWLLNNGVLSLLAKNLFRRRNGTIRHLKE